MKVTRLQIGVYSNQQPFCLYLFPLVASSSSLNGQDLHSRTTHQPFYRLRDVDAIFFESKAIGYIYNSGKIPRVYFDTPGYCFYERSGDIYLAARAISDTGTRLGNHLLAEFCKYGRSEIISGMADKLLENVDITRTPVVEAEFEFVTVDSIAHQSSYASYTPTTSPIQNDTRSPTNLNSSSNGHLSPPPTNGRKRMSLEEVLDNNNDTNNRRYASNVTSPVECTVSPVGSDRGTPTIKQEPSPSCSGSENSNPSSPNQSPRSPHSPSSPLEVVDEENRMRKRRRVAVSTIGPNNIKVTNNPEVMEQVRNTLKLKQQQKAIIEARQQQAQQQMLQQNFIDRRHSSQGTWESNRTSNTLSKRNSVSNRSNRNSRNLSVFAPPYNDASNLSSSVSPSVSKVRGQNSAGLTNNRQSLPMTAPIPVNRSALNRQSLSGFPLSANSAFRPTSQSLNTHSASTSASINGLISPHNVEDVRSNSVSSSPLPSPSPRLSRTSKFVTSSMSHTNGEQPSKESFIHLFDSFYDTVSDTRSLKTTLEDQIRKTTTLLQTLQASGSMIESLVRGHFREMQREVVKDLMTLEKRLSKVEERMRGNTSVGMSPSPPLDPDRRLSNISTASSDMGYNHNKNVSTFVQNANNSSSPPLSAISSHSNGDESQPKDYEYILKALKARLESLERRMSVP